MTSYIPFLAFIFIGAFTPGPNNCMALSHAARGLRSGVTFSVGVFGGMLITMSACGLLSSFLTRHLDSAELIMKIIGCAYMVWLAWRLWKSGGVNDGPVQGQRKLLITGCALQLVNPKLIAYGITAFSVFILPSFHEVTILIWFAVLLAVVGFAGTLTWAFCGAGLKRIFQAHPTLINRVLAVLVLVCAASLIM
ncbi:MAG: LysE family transporter [Deltaproteobacteria bacterium]|jgi:threonine/homoserine/homoserine lactone efflux protein|nr:LysE family transporter [Deltaproteobacteria bacterium]